MSCFIMWLAVLVVLVLILMYRWYRQSQILENLTDKYVFITGCDSGFGNMLAKQLDRRGMRVLAACFSEKGAGTLKKETSSRLQTVILDVTDSTSVSSAAKWVSNTVGNKGLWGVVNNAGYSLGVAPNEWQKIEDYAKVLNVNLLGMINVTVHLLHLVRKAQGRIVNVSSGVGRLSTFGGGYCPSKFGVEAFSDSLRREMRDFGVKVSIIEPGAFQTTIIASDMHVNFLRRLWENLPTAVKESYGHRYYEKCVKGLESLERTASPRIHMVPDCMEHAVTAVYPWTRYSPGWDCKFYFIPLSYLPTVISDYVLCRSAPKPACM
ncbi:retinol dehydrogenase 7-like [Pseudophryne corroboree]|uniref:retinol dehydrogenase 7-like n=1 Tax=Pseudophryne corroboree TaxID=495146 RepID=UPI003081EDC3